MGLKTTTVCMGYQQITPNAATALTVPTTDKNGNKQQPTLIVITPEGQNVRWRDDGTDPTGFYNAEFQVPLKDHDQWPAVVERTGWRRLLGKRARTKEELVVEMQETLDNAIPGVDSLNNKK